MSRIIKSTLYVSLVIILGSCRTSGPEFLKSLASDEPVYETYVDAAPIKEARSVIVCRAKQCAPAKLSMSKEYIYNSLLHLMENNNHKRALLCEADAPSRTCTESFVTVPIRVGITPANMYLDSVKISDISVGKGQTVLNLLLNYNVTYNGQTPDCLPSQSIMYVKNVNNIIMEDGGYSCKMTSIGQTSIKTVFAIDYIDLDYGFIGGYYSIGTSGPAYGGGTGYMLLRLPKDAYPLSPSLVSKQTKKQKKVQKIINEEVAVEPEPSSSAGSNVQVFPISK